MGILVRAASKVEEGMQSVRRSLRLETMMMNETTSFNRKRMSRIEADIRRALSRGIEEAIVRLEQMKRSLEPK
jgi:hypothetical protein